MAGRKFPRPGKFTPLLEDDGRTINQQWFDFLGYLESRGVLDLPDVDNSTPIADTQVLIYNAISKKLKPGAN